MKKIVLVLVMSMLLLVTRGYALDYPWEKDKGTEGKKEVPEDSSNQDSNPSGESSKPIRVKIITVTGEITAIDWSAGIIIVRGKRGDESLLIDSAHYKDLKVGDMVKAVYIGSGSESGRVKKITVRGAIRFREGD